MEIAGQCEIDEYCQKILTLRWPDVPKWRDIKNVTGKEVFEKCGSIDLVSGGFPCQPFSVAGKRKGKDDDRYLWPEMLRVISEIKPAWVFGENVVGLKSRGLDQVLSDLENIGYATQSFIVPACAFNAPHKRERVWVLAYSTSAGQKMLHENKVFQFSSDSWWQTEPGICRVADGTPAGMDRLKLLGNGQVVQCVEWFGKAIMEVSRCKFTN